MTRTYLLALTLLSCAVAFAHAAEEEAEGAPWFCHGLDCPAFKVVNSTDKYEIRKLEGGSWAATKVSSLLYSVGVSEGFERLFKYISGANKGEKKIEMTVPVVTRIVPGDGPFCKSNFSVHFYVPYDYQGKAPEPSNPDVYIEEAKSETFAVTQFGGFLVDDITLTSKARGLQKALDADKVSYDTSSYFAAGYDPPTRLTHRHNEVWVRIPSKSASEIAEEVVVQS